MPIVYTLTPILKCIGPCNLFKSVCSMFSCSKAPSMKMPGDNICDWACVDSLKTFTFQLVSGSSEFMPVWTF